LKLLPRPSRQPAAVQARCFPKTRPIDPLLLIGTSVRQGPDGTGVKRRASGCAQPPFHASLAGLRHRCRSALSDACTKGRIDRRQLKVAGLRAFHGAAIREDGGIRF
jgi:hypothetical protein